MGGVINFRVSPTRKVANNREVALTLSCQLFNMRPFLKKPRVPGVQGGPDSAVCRGVCVRAGGTAYKRCVCRGYIKRCQHLHLCFIISSGNCEKGFYNLMSEKQGFEGRTCSVNLNGNRSGGLMRFASIDSNTSRSELGYQHHTEDRRVHSSQRESIC